MVVARAAIEHFMGNDPPTVPIVTIVVVMLGKSLVVESAHVRVDRLRRRRLTAEEVDRRLARIGGVSWPAAVLVGTLEAG